MINVMDTIKTINDPRKKIVVGEDGCRSRFESSVDFQRGSFISFRLIIIKKSAKAVRISQVDLTQVYVTLLKRDSNSVLIAMVVKVITKALMVAFRIPLSKTR